MAEILKTLENDHLAVVIREDASASISDKTTGETWRMGPLAIQEFGPIDIGWVWPRRARSMCEQYPGRFRGSMEGDGLRFIVIGERQKEMGSFACEVRLDGPWLEFKLTEIAEELPSLVFPPPVESESLVFPAGVGKWMKKPLDKERYFWSLYNGLNMRWFGGLRGKDRGWLCVFAEGHADAGILIAAMSAAPGWLKSLERWTFPRAARYRFTQGGYVGLAKTYRRWAIEHGLHRSLEEKMAACPAVRNLLGGRMVSLHQAHMTRRELMENRLRPVPKDSLENDGNVKVHFTHRETGKLIKEAKTRGMKHGLFNIRGWIQGGYDWSHPDVWPPEPALGTADELRNNLQQGSAFTTALHDNYQDIYAHCPSFPKGVIRLPDGELMRGGVWAGGQAYILNARNGLDYAKRNWEKIKPLAPSAMFIDTVTAVRLYQSFEQGNTLTRTEDEEYLGRLLAFYKEQGLALGSEEAAEFGCPWLDWLENRHLRAAGESIPIWPLVYHDSVFCTRYSHRLEGASGWPAWLPDMLWGYFIQWRPASPEGLDHTHDKSMGKFTDTFFVDEWHGRAGASEMVSHRYLTEDCELEQTEFAGGLAIAANFALEERQADGITIPPGGYVIRD